jgi:pyrroline-5-carboxylate reductase
MASAMIRGFLSARLYRPTAMWATDVVRTKRRELGRRFGIGWADGNQELVAGSEIVVLAVKPQSLPEVLREIRPNVARRHLFVSIAAGFPLRRLEEELGPTARVVRVMPNTPALCGRGMSVLVRGRRASGADERAVLRMFRAVGDAVAVRDESLLDPVTGLSGSGPAYVYRFAEALIAAGVAQGLEAVLSGRLVFQTLEGACAMLRETGKSPEELRQMVSSPGGTTLAGLAVLEEGRFFDTVIGAVGRATARSRELGQAV